MDGFFIKATPEAIALLEHLARFKSILVEIKREIPRCPSGNKPGMLIYDGDWIRSEAWDVLFAIFEDRRINNRLTHSQWGTRNYLTTHFCGCNTCTGEFQPIPGCCCYPCNTPGSVDWRCQEAIVNKVRKLHQSFAKPFPLNNFDFSTTNPFKHV